MPIEYTAITKDGYMVFIPEGSSDSPAELAAYIEALLAVSEKEAVHKILLDHRKINLQFEQAGTYELAAQCIDMMSSDRPMKVALVAPPERMDFARIYETIGVTRGVNIKAFEDDLMASSWLST